MSEVEVHAEPGKCAIHDRGLFYAIDFDGYLCFACLHAEPVIVAVPSEVKEAPPLTPAMKSEVAESYQRRQRDRDRAEARGEATS
jgi:hypothetical protein